MLTAASLTGYTLKDLAQMAKTRGVRGWHEMRKEQLIKALLRVARRKSAAQSRRGAKLATATRPRQAPKPAALVKPPAVAMAKVASHARNGVGKPQPQPPANGSAAHLTKPRDPQIDQRLRQMWAATGVGKDLSTASVGESNGAGQERMVLMVRGPYWLHAYWELSRRGVERARAAMGQDWHAARPVLRLCEVATGPTTSSVESVVRDISIHGGVNNWYIDVSDPPKAYRLSIGYLSATGKYFPLAKSNTVTTPPAGGSDDIDSNWSEVAENYEKIFAMSSSPEGPSTELRELFEERLRRPMNSPAISQVAPSIETFLPKKRPFNFEVDAELIVFGATDPDAHVTLLGDPVKLRPDGTFTVRYCLPNCRQVIPAVACSRDGIEQRTVVLAVERNTKTMEPFVRDAAEG